MRSAAQSRKVERKPWTVMSARPIRFNTAAIAMLPRAPRRAGLIKTAGLPFSIGNARRISTARVGQRDAMFFAAFDPPSGYGASLYGQINFVPDHADDFASPRGVKIKIRGCRRRCLL